MMSATVIVNISEHFILLIRGDFFSVTVHTLTAADIDLVAASGDSITVSFVSLIYDLFLL